MHFRIPLWVGQFIAVVASIVGVSLASSDYASKVLLFGDSQISRQ